MRKSKNFHFQKNLLLIFFVLEKGTVSKVAFSNRKEVKLFESDKHTNTTGEEYDQRKMRIVWKYEAFKFPVVK